MIKIQLSKGSWEYNPNLQLGKPGGFGAVFAGRGEGLDQVAIKRLHISASDAAHRELRIADKLSSLSLEFVVPFLDSGQDEESESYFVVMARAERSLQEEIDRRSKFNDEMTVRILQDIASGLSEAQGLVHRDLKPANVLYHDGRWKVADFGIARFVEESTSLQTLKNCLSPPYAAPEQWRFERASSATDIYALGCIAYALLTGKPPFTGPGPEDYRDQHINAAPAPLTESQPRLRSLVLTMLRKTPQGRPSLERVRRSLDDLVASGLREEQGKGLAALEQAGAEAAEKALRADSKQMQQEMSEKSRKELSETAFETLDNVVDTLLTKILNAAPIAKRAYTAKNQLTGIVVGSASLEIDLSEFDLVIPEDAFKESGWDVVAGVVIRVIQLEPSQYVWSANLWYTNLGSTDDYRWWEVTYFYIGAGRTRPRPGYEPFALKDLSDADLAAAPKMHVINIAKEPVQIDDEDANDFCDRWAGLLAKAYNGQLKSPSNFPIS